MYCSDLIIHVNIEAINGVFTESSYILAVAIIMGRDKHNLSLSMKNVLFIKLTLIFT